MPEHIPRVPAEHAERIRRWHEAAQAAARNEGARAQTFEYLGLSLVVPPGVQPITRVSHLLGEAVLAETRAGERVLDMGTGCGVNGILAARRGARVVAVDVNPAAVAATRDNAARNGVALDVRQSDVFGAVDGAFDLIVFDPPFRWFPARDAFERATTDPGYGALNAFFAGLPEHLAPGGRLLLFFGTSGDAPYLHERIVDAGLRAERIATAQLERDEMTVEYFTLRVRCGEA